jgi:hypothetical protein
LFSAAVLLHRYCIAEAEINPFKRKNGMDNNEYLHLNQIEWKYGIYACLLLAAEQNEWPRRLRDVVNLLHILDCRDNIVHRNGEIFFPDPKARQALLKMERRFFAVFSDLMWWYRVLIAP